MKEERDQGSTSAIPKGNREVKTFCRLCGARCRIVLCIEDGKIAKVKPDGDALCPKGRALGEIVHAPDRILYPLKRNGSRLKRVSWDEALDFVAARLNDIRQSYGPQALAVHMGFPTVLFDSQDYIRRFCNLFGTPNLSSAASHCHLALVMGNALTYGVLPVPDYEQTRCIVLWGCNPYASNRYALTAILKAVRRGAKLVVIDPRGTELAVRAELHLQLRPGTDRALALGMLHVFVGERLYDNEFVARWTLGFDELKKTLQEYTPEKVQESTGVPADMIRQAARLYGSTKPACIVQGNGLELHADGIQAIRAVSILQAISGNLDVSGGARLNPGHGLASLEIDTAKTAAAAIGADAYPVYYDFRKEAHGNLLADAVLESKPYPIRGMIVTGADPILTFPNAVKMREAMGKLDFLAVMDLFPTETVEHADIVLPAATFLERTELNDLRLRYPLPRIALAQSVLPAQGESWPDLKFWFELARRMGYGEYFPWRDIREAIAFRVKPLGITVEQLEEAPAGLPFMAEQYKKYEEKGFTTPSGKVEIYSQRLKDLGYHPLPTYEIGPACDKVLVISTGARVGEYIHARFRNILSLRKRKPEPFAEISPQTARELGLTDGDMAVIKTKVGEIDIRVQVSEAIIPDAVFVTHGWGEANANILTDDENLDPISGFPLFRSMPCSLERKAE